MHVNVVVLADYGAFVEIMPGVEALIHVSEMSWSYIWFKRLFKTWQVEAQVLTLDREERKMSLGIKQLTQTMGQNFCKYPIESKHRGVVKNFTNFGILLN